MSTKFRNNVIWVDFKTKREYDLSKFGHPEKVTQPIPYLCTPKRTERKKNGHR